MVKEAAREAVGRARPRAASSTTTPPPSSPRSSWPASSYAWPSRDPSAPAGTRRRDATPREPAAVGTPAPAPRPSPAPGLATLEPRLLSLSRDTSYGAAAARLEASGRGRRSCARPLRTHLPQVKRLDLPVLLEMFHPARRDTCFLALLGVAGDEATVAVGDEPPFRVSLAELDRYWTRDAVFLWRDFDAVSSGEDTLRTAAWARTQLERLGYGTHGPDSVLRFQRESDLIADGVVGSRTLMTLYSRGEWPRPRLNAEAPAPASAGGSLVSLILEALKKLERDKQAPDRGFLVVAHVPWAAKAQGTRLWLGIAGAPARPGARGGSRVLVDTPAAPRSCVPAAAPPEATLAVPAAPRPSPPTAPALPAVSLPAPARSAAPARRRRRASPCDHSCLLPKGELRLNAISQREGQWVAVLNDRLVREGDEFDGIRVCASGRARSRWRSRASDASCASSLRTGQAGRRRDGPPGSPFSCGPWRPGRSPSPSPPGTSLVRSWRHVADDVVAAHLAPDPAERGQQRVGEARGESTGGFGEIDRHPPSGSTPSRRRSRGADRVRAARRRRRRRRRNRSWSRPAGQGWPPPAAAARNRGAGGSPARRGRGPCGPPPRRARANSDSRVPRRPAVCEKIERNWPRVAVSLAGPSRVSAVSTMPSGPVGPDQGEARGSSPRATATRAARSVGIVPSHASPLARLTRRTQSPGRAASRMNWTAPSRAAGAGPVRARRCPRAGGCARSRGRGGMGVTTRPPSSLEVLVCGRAFLDGLEECYGNRFPVLEDLEGRGREPGEGPASARPPPTRRAGSSGRRSRTRGAAAPAEASRLRSQRRRERARATCLRSIRSCLVYRMERAG